MENFKENDIELPECQHASNKADNSESVTASRIIDMASAGQQFVTHLPYYSSIKAACHDLSEIDVPCEDVQWIDVSDEMSRLDESMFVVSAMGDSMQPKINDGDYCVFHIIRVEVVKEKLYWSKVIISKTTIVIISPVPSKNITVKSELQKMVGNVLHIELIPLNKEYESFSFNPEDEGFKVLGVLKKVIRK